MVGHGFGEGFIIDGEVLWCFFFFLRVLLQSAESSNGCPYLYGCGVVLNIKKKLKY